MQRLQSFAENRWHEAAGGFRPLRDAATQDAICEISSQGLDFGAMHAYARRVGGPNLRKHSLHERARMVKALAAYLNERKEELYELSFATGATRKDSWPDIDGGIATAFVISSKGRRDLPDGHIIPDGAFEQISRSGSFLGQHVYTPLQGVAIHINAYNFPCWGMLEKLAPTLIAGVPAIVKPATPTAFLAERLFHMIIESGTLPEGAVQFVAGSTGDLLSYVDCQDVISFTGSAHTAEKLSQTPAVVSNATRFIAERDSLNASILGPDAAPGEPEFDLFVKELVREMTSKAGQKCTAIRRAIVPADRVEAVTAAVRERLAGVTLGDPRDESVRMGALAGVDQRDDVLEKIRELQSENQIVVGDLDCFEAVGADARAGAFLPPILMRCEDPIRLPKAHSVEPFGPVSTLMPYRDVDDAVAIANKGEGSLVASLFTHSPDVARQVVMGSGSYHGRLYIVDRTSAREATGHGSPLAHLVHGGPGRAGGGEEMGGARGVKHYMQRTAVQGSPAVIAAVSEQWTRGAPEISTGVHPFRRSYDELVIGETFTSPEREITMADIEHFAEFTGDTFYAHMDEEAAAASPFFDGRVAHGYLLLSFAAGLFVEPAPGPVLANTGLDNLRFMKPVYPGDRMSVRLTVMRKTMRQLGEYGEVRWDVEARNQDGEPVAQYELLTMCACS